jgi:tetratricopeptide (TPR) repeat protein
VDEEDPVTFANLAGVYWELGDFDMAVYNYHRSIKLDPDIEETYYNIINLYIEMGSLYMAFMLCLEFQSRFPENSEASDLLSDIILNLGLSLY